VTPSLGVSQHQPPPAPPFSQGDPFAFSKPAGLFSEFPGLVNFAFFRLFHGSLSPFRRGPIRVVCAFPPFRKPKLWRSQFIGSSFGPPIERKNPSSPLLASCAVFVCPFYDGEVVRLLPFPPARPLRAQPPLSFFSRISCWRLVAPRQTPLLYLSPSLVLYWGFFASRFSWSHFPLFLTSSQFGPKSVLPVSFSFALTSSERFPQTRRNFSIPPPTTNQPMPKRPFRIFLFFFDPPCPSSTPCRFVVTFYVLFLDSPPNPPPP